MPGEQPPMYNGPAGMTEEQRLQALQEWAESKKYIQQGQDGTLPMVQGGGGWAFTHGEKPEGTLAPPGYADESTGKGEAAHKEKEPGPVKRWLEHQKEKKEERRASQAQ